MLQLPVSTKMADDTMDHANTSAVVELLKSLNDNITELKTQNKQVSHRLDSLEGKKSANPLSPVASIGLNQSEKCQ